MTEILPNNVDLQLLARLAAARGVTVLAAAPSFRWRKRSLLERLLEDFGRAFEREPLPAAVGEREIRRLRDDRGDIWLCSPSTAAELNALLSYDGRGGVGGAAAATVAFSKPHR